MGGPTSPTLFHLLPDWSSNWTDVRTRKKNNHPKAVQKTSHRNKNWAHNSHMIIQSVLLLLNAHITFSHSLTSRISSPGAPSDIQYWISTSRKSDPQELQLEFAGQAKWATWHTKIFLCRFLSSWAVVLTALPKLLMPQMKLSFSMIFTYQTPDF